MTETVDKRDKAVIALSGGIDSITILYKLIEQGYNVYPVLFRMKNVKQNTNDWHVARSVCKSLKISLKVVNLDINKMPKKTFVDSSVATEEEKKNKITGYPFRNFLFLSYLVNYAETLGAKKVSIGTTLTTNAQAFPDCTLDSTDLFKELVKEATSNRVQLYSPFLESTKEQVIREAVRLKVPIAKTVTCFEGKRKGCGKCDACIDKLQALDAAGVVKKYLKYYEDVETYKTTKL
jgi:7-cyano-7-deazaguanine synthase